MFNNLTNFLNLITNRKIKTAATIEDTDLIPLGTQDPTFLGGYQPTAITYKELVDSLPVDGVASISDNGTGVVTVDNTDPENPVIDFNGVNVDNVTVTGDGTPGNPLVAISSSTNIYNSDGTLTGNRTVNLNNNTLTFTGGIINFDQGSTNSGEIRFYEDSDFGNNYVSLRAPQVMSTNREFFLPGNAPTNGYFLQTFGGFGSTQWVPAPGGLPAWVETDATDLTIWCNGKGDIASNTGFGENSLQANTTGNQSSAFGVDALAANTTGFSNTAIGWKTLEIASTPNWNTAVGAEALRRTTSGQSNTALGEAALPNNNIGSFNVGVGSGALRNNTTGSSNIAIGFETLRTNTTGSELVAIGQDAMRQFAMNNGRSTAIGFYSMRETVTGNGNTAVGHNTLRNNTTGGLNSVVGVDALRDNTTGQQNVVLGYQCLYSNTTGSNNVALGSGALALNQVGGNNIAIGNNALEKTNTSFNIGIGNVALKNATTGGSNIAIGSAALELTTTAQNNIAIGGNALQNNTTGSNNVAIGATALSSNTTGGTNTAVGEATSSGNFNASVILGYGATATGNNQFVVGSAGWNAGAITTETIVPSVTWTVRINGANYKIPLLPV